MNATLVVSLRELAGGDWNSVYVSHQPVSRDYLESEVGGKIDMDETFMQQGNILVFLKDGRIARATYITPDLLQSGEYSGSVRITAEGYPRTAPDVRIAPRRAACSTIGVAHECHRR
ncbi:hypothetical protein IU479_32595 [Nocardia abscessus]|uniref:hypothetical protein n=1 Tax=Nocardia abscessus TaxID=120957 RepID=UPI00189531A1|nr:hypothetical protein [Nocardia abscessus]MBF6222826.1 hypothetical protein [Nocardia abscessus]